MDESRGARDKCSSSDVRRTAIKTGRSKSAIEPDHDAQWSHRATAFRPYTGPFPRELVRQTISAWRKSA